MGKDFRVGDVVCTQREGTGEVYEVDFFKPWAVSVRFVETLHCNSFTLDGFCRTTDMHPVLYHGTWEEVFGNIPEIKPKRTKKLYLNVWLGDYDIPYCCLYDSKVGAISTKDKYMWEARYKFVKVAEEVEVEE